MLLLRRSDPGSHLLECPDAVVIESSTSGRVPNGHGTSTVTFVLAVQCGHGSDAAKLTTTLHIVPNEP